MITFTENCILCRWDLINGQYKFIKKASFPKYNHSSVPFPITCEIDRIFVDKSQIFLPINSFPQFLQVEYSDLSLSLNA